MKFLILSLVFGLALAAPQVNKVAEDEVAIDQAQMPWDMMGMMGNMGGMGMMGPWAQPQNNNNQEYAIDYSMQCSSSCNCGMVCMPWWPCGCRCPPPCPTEAPTTTTPAPLCINGAPDSTFPWCCKNGATNQLCCLPGSTAPECNPIQNTTPAPDDCPNCCVPCMPCMPCMIWWMCNPCNCNNGCVTAPPPTQPPCNPCSCTPCVPWFPCSPCECNNPCPQPNNQRDKNFPRENERNNSNRNDNRNHSRNQDRNNDWNRSRW